MNGKTSLAGMIGQGGVAVFEPSRVLRRVPLDFDAPLNVVWPGFLLGPAPCPRCGSPEGGPSDDVTCLVCDNDEWRPVEPPPTGAGFQLWETITEGSPQSPVFATLEELCAWCADHSSVFADMKASASEWRAILTASAQDARC